MKRFIKTLAAGALGVLAAALSASPAAADTIYSFKNITHKNAANAAAGEAQLSVVVSDAGSNKVSFKFQNSGPVAMSITDVYFDDGTLLGATTLADSGSGVDFAFGATPNDMPGGSSIDPKFVTSTRGIFSADSDSPIQQMGVNPGEWLTVTFDLINLKTFDDTLAALKLGLTDGGNDNALRIGIHVQAIGTNEGSESFINGSPGSSVPLPGVAVAGAVLMSGAALRRRRVA